MPQHQAAGLHGFNHLLGQVGGNHLQQRRTVDIQSHADGHGFAVPDLISCEGFQFMGRPVPEVQGSRRTFFKGIPTADVFEMQSGAFQNEIFQRRPVVCPYLFGIVSDEAVEILIFYKGDFKHFGHTGKDIPGLQRSKKIVVDDHSIRWIKTAEEVFYPLVVNPVFNAHTRVILGKHGRGHLDLPHPSVEDGRRKAHRIQNGTAADDHHVGVPAKSGIHHSPCHCVDGFPPLFDGFAPGNDLHRNDQIHDIRMPVRPLLRLAGQCRKGFSDLVIEEDHHIGSIFTQNPGHCSIFRIEQAAGVDDLVLVVHFERLFDDHSVLHGLFNTGCFCGNITPASVHCEPQSIT